MKCPTCSFDNPAGVSACTSCGSPIGPSGTRGPDSGAAGSRNDVTNVSGPNSGSLPRNTRLQNNAFALADVLGQGGFGITYKAGDMKLRRLVAIKEFFPYGARRQGSTVHPPAGTTEDVYGQSKQGFIHEAKTLARFNHPGIVRVFGAFEENNTAYMVMELLEGKSLQQLLDTNGHLDQDEAVRIVTQVAVALTAVHEAKLLHRDIKPENIFLVSPGTPQERIVLIDFGTAREFAANKTRAMTAMVTHGYAPLEQYGKQAKFGPYTDVYALGATLYHCLTGQLPASAMDRLSGVDLQPPAQVNPNIRPGLSTAVMWALEIKATDRPPSVAEWVDGLKTGNTPTSVQARMQAPPPPAPVPPPTLPAAPPPMPGTNQMQSRFCPHCGSQMSVFMSICPNCKKKNTAPALPAPPSPAAWDNVALRVLVGIGVFIVVSGVLFGHARSPAPDDSNSVTATTPGFNPAPADAPTPLTSVTPMPSRSVPTPTARTPNASDAYDFACSVLRTHLERPDDATVLDYGDNNCNVFAGAPNEWSISSEGTGVTTSGQTVDFRWHANVYYSPSNDTFRGTADISDD